MDWANIIDKTLFCVFIAAIFIGIAKTTPEGPTKKELCEKSGGKLVTTVKTFTECRKNKE